MDAHSLKNSTLVATAVIQCRWVCCCRQAWAGERSEKHHMKEVLRNKSSKNAGGPPGTLRGEACGQETHWLCRNAEERQDRERAEL